MLAAGCGASSIYSTNSLPTLLALTFGGMGLLPCVAVARVFALVVRCSFMLLLGYSRVGKNRDTKRESPGGAGGGPWRQPQIIHL